MQELKQFGIIPIDFKTISSKLTLYRSPRDKVSRLEKSGDLIRLKKGLYIVSPDILGQSVSKELIANHLYGPSYVSLENALSFYGLIPERVFTTLSITLKRRKSYNTPLGDFEYITVPVKYFSIGISQKIVQNSYAYLLATPEKALCDLIVTKSGIRFQSLKAIKEYLVQDLRVDFDVIKKWNLTIIDECIKYGYKKVELRLLSKFMEYECSI
ncbi:MAG: hypothetical protein K8S16_04675 [Bacteroidales bacterium]|nr:hypothetical protein [Bacteroidales bacterium]